VSEASITDQIREYTAADGTLLKYRHYRPAGEPRAYIVGVHGIQSHSGWYEWSSSRLAAAGYDVRFLDRRGSGLNEHERDCAKSTEGNDRADLWDSTPGPPRTRGASSRGERPRIKLACLLCRDVLQIVSGLREERSANQPLILAGVSWAGKLLAGGWPELERRQERNPGAHRGGPSDQPGPPAATPHRSGIRKNSAAAGDGAESSELLRVQLRRGIDGVALLYPAIFTRFDPHVIQRGAIRAAVALGLGRRTVPIPLDDPALFTDDPNWQQFIREDPQALRRVSLSFLKATLDLTAQAERFPERNPPPTFIALAGRDRIVDLHRTRDWASRLPAESTRVVEYSAARHTLEFDQCREQFVADLIEWIESLVKSRQR
jgi:acylglycerol lipase